jgi:DNA-binding transcriptional ArsR family regulator
MTAQGEAPFAYEGLDRVIHEKARLGIMTSLVAHPKGLPFAELKRLCGLTDGNLSRHLQVLQDAGFIRINKEFRDNRPLTTCMITPRGQERFVEYIELLEVIVRDAANARQAEPRMPAKSALRPA